MSLIYPFGTQVPHVNISTTKFHVSTEFHFGTHVLLGTQVLPCTHNVSIELLSCTQQVSIQVTPGAQVLAPCIPTSNRCGTWYFNTNLKEMGHSSSSDGICSALNDYSSISTGDNVSLVCSQRICYNEGCVLTSPKMRKKTDCWDAFAQLLFSLSPSLESPRGD